MQCLKPECDGHYQPICDKCEYTGWIKIKDKKPLENQWVFVGNSKHGSTTFGIYMDGVFVNPDFNYLIPDFNYLILEPITHWMELPNPPKEDE